MANQINFGYVSGRTLTYGAYQPDGTVRTAAGTSLPEVSGTGYYTATDNNLVALDFVIVKEGSTIVGAGQYMPDVTASAVTTALVTIDTNVDTINTNVSSILATEGKVLNKWP
jgi:hypothetical protein